MAISYKKQYTSEAEYMYDLARSSELYRDATYNFAVANEQDEDYAYALAGTKTKESDTFDLIEYDLLSGEDQYMYLLNEYYVDKNETAVDEETGKTYNVYQRNREYLDYKIEEAIDLQTYESLSGFEKFIHTIGGILGNAFNELFLGTIEGLVDLGAVIVGQKDWAATDFTGVQANRESLQRYARAYTYLDKSAFWKGANDVVTGITKMAPLLIPYAGQAIYFGAMAGNTAEEAIRANPDIDYGSLLLYTTGTTAVEFATEKISSFLFGTGKLVGGAKGANFLTRFGLDFLSEGFEEGVAEIAGSILYQQMVDPNAPIASIGDVMYAALIGGLIGGVATTGRVAGTRSKTVLADGTVVDTKVAKQQGLEGKKLSKTKSLYLQEQISDIRDAMSESEVTKLQSKYSGESLQAIQQNHTEEYDRAVQQDAELQERMVESSLGLSKILEMAGVEGFAKASELVNYTTEQKARLINNFVATATGTTAENRAVEEKFKQMNGGVSSFTITDTLNATQQTLKNKIKQLYGKNVYFGNLGEQDGVFRRHGLTLDENTIIIDINIEQEMSVDKIINEVVKEELVHTLQFEKGILDAKTIYDLMEQYKKLGGTTQQVELDEAYRTSSDLTKISEAQAKVLAETLLFDKFTVSRIFSTNRNLFDKIYNWARNIKEGIENLKNRKTNKDKVKYRQLLKIMKTYRDSAAENIGNDEDANAVVSEMRLTEEQAQELFDTYQPDATNEHFTLLKAEYTIHTQQRMAAEKLLLKARNPIMSLKNNLEFKYIFDESYWGTIDNGRGEQINFVEVIKSRDPSKDFRRNLQEFMIEVTGFAINQREGCLMEVLDYNTVTTNEFDQTLAELQTNPDALSKYTRLSDIFNEEFNRKFVTIDGVNDLEDIDLRFIPRETDENLQAKYEGMNPETQKPTVTVYLKAGQTLNTKQIENLKHKLFHEVTHALSDIQGLPNGTSYNYVRTALQELDRGQINRLGKLLLTDEFFNENKNNLNILMDNIAYGIYRITDGEYAAEAYATSLTRKGDMKVNLKAGATMNRSGFRTDGLFIEGYGRFKGISLYATNVVQAKQSYKLSALRKASEVVAFSMRNDLANHLKSMGIDDYQKAGFSENFIQILNNPNSKMSQIWEAIIKNEVGNNNATNAIYRFVTSKQQLKDTYLRRIQSNNERIKELEGKTDEVSKKKLEKLEETKRKNKQRFDEINSINVSDNESVNKNMVTASDVSMATSYGIAMARLVWYVVKRTNTSERLDEPKLTLNEISRILGKPVEYNTPLTFDELSKILNNSDPRIARKLDTMISQTATLFDEEKNTNIIKYLLQTDYSYSQSDTNELLKRLKGLGINKDAPLIEETQTTQGREGEEEVSVFEEIEDVEQTRAMEKIEGDVDVEEDLYPDEKTPVDRYITTLKKAMEQVGDSRKLFNIRIKIKGDKQLITDIYGEEGWKSIIEIAPEEESNYKQTITRRKTAINKKTQTLTDSEQKLMNVDTSNFTPNQYEEYIKQLDEIKLKYVAKAKSVTKKPAVKKEKTTEPIKEEKIVKITPKKEVVSEEKVVEPEIKETKSEDKKIASQLVDVANAIPADILKILENAKKDESEAQLFEGANKEFTRISTNMVSDNMDKFLQINDNNYEQIRQSVATNSTALILFDYYTVKYIGSFGKETQTKILNNTRTEQTLAAQRQGIQSKRVKDNKPATDLKNTLENQGYEVVLTEDTVIEILGEDAIVDKDAEIKRLEVEIEKLKNYILNDIKNNHKMAQQEDERQLKLLTDRKAAIESGDLFEMLDTVINQMGIESATKTIERLMRKVIQTMGIKNKEIGVFAYDKKGNLKSFPKLRNWVGDKLLKAKKFRMWAMLSSPVTWVRNWIGNKGMQALDSMTNVVERALTKNTAIGKNIEGDSLKFNESKAGKELYKQIDAEYGDYIIHSVIRKEDARYDITGQKNQDIEQKKREQKIASGNAFEKTIARALNATTWGLERGPLGDEPRLLNSICKNTANLIASNIDWCLQGIRNEALPLTEMLDGGRTLTKEQQQRLTVLQKALNSKNLMDITNAISEDAMKYLINNAGERSFDQYFKNPNAFSDWINNLGNKSPIMAELMSWVMPFPKVAANVLKMAYRYSPLGFLRGLSQMSLAKQQKLSEYKGPIDEFAESKAIRSLSEATVGTFMWIVGMIAGALGWIEMDDDDYMGPSIKIGDFKMSLSNLAPSMTVLSVGAAMVSGWKNKEVGLRRSLSVLYDNTLLGNFDNLFNYSSTESFLENLSISYMGQYVPAFIKMVAKVSDRRKMDKTGPYWDKLWKTFKSYIPGLSYTVPSKINPYTGESTYRSGTGSWFFNIWNALSPLEIQYQSKSDFEKMAEKYNAETTGLSGRFTINTKDYTVTNKQKESLSKFRANYLQTEYESIVSGKQKVTVEDDKGKRITTTWNKLTDSQKSKVLKNLYSKATDATKIKYWISEGNQYVVTDRDLYNTYKKLFGSTQGLVYKQSWSKSKFIER